MKFGKVKISDLVWTIFIIHALRILGESFGPYLTEFEGYMRYYGPFINSAIVIVLVWCYCDILYRVVNAVQSMIKE